MCSESLSASQVLMNSHPMELTAQLFTVVTNSSKACRAVSLS